MEAFEAEVTICLETQSCECWTSQRLAAAQAKSFPNQEQNEMLKRKQEKRALGFSV